MKHSYCFDIDGTLLSTGGAGGRSFKKAILQLFKKEPDFKRISMAGRLDPSIFNEILGLIDEEFSESKWDAFKEVYLNYLKEESMNLTHWKVFDGVFEILDSILKTNEKPCLLTGNIKEGAFLKLKALELEKYFDWENSIFGDEGKIKREELVVPLKLKHKGKLPVVIGDTPADILVGKLSGGISVAVATGMHTLEELREYEPDFAIRNLSEFPILF